MKRIIAMLICVCFFMCGCSKKPLPVISVIDNKFNISSHDFSDALYSVKSHKEMVEERMLAFEDTATHDLKYGVNVKFQGEKGQTQYINIKINSETESTDKAGEVFYTCFYDIVHLIYPNIPDTDFLTLSSSFVAAFEEEDSKPIYYEDIRFGCSIKKNGDFLVFIDGFGDFESTK